MRNGYYLHPEVEELPHVRSTAESGMSSYAVDYQRQRGRKFNENRLRMLTCIYEVVTERIFGVTFDLSNSAHYRHWLQHTRHNWQLSIPDYDLSSQSTESMSSSRAETMSIAVHSQVTNLADFMHCDDFGSRQFTRPLESQQPVPSPIEADEQPHDPTSQLPIISVPLVMNWEQGGYRRRRLDEQPPSPSNLQPDDATRPAQRRRFVHNHSTPAVDTFPHHSNHSP